MPNAGATAPATPQFIDTAVLQIHSLDNNAGKTLNLNVDFIRQDGSNILSNSTSKKSQRTVECADDILDRLPKYCLRYFDLRAFYYNK
jgi:hypothetical protein